MNAITSSELQKGGPITADVAAFAEMPPASQEVKRDLNEAALDTRDSEVMTEARQLAPLFVPEVAQEFRSRWDTVQRGFVDDPRQAVRQGDELVGLVMKSLAETFSQERATLEGQLGQADKESTETLRIALRRYRSFFERLLAF